MSTLRTTNVIHGSSAITNIVLDNQGRAIFGPDSPQGRAALYVNAQSNRVGVNTETPSVELDVDGQISATGNATVGGTLSVTGNVTLNAQLTVTGSVVFNGDIDASSQIITASRFINSTTSADPWLKGVDVSNTETSFITKDGRGYFDSFVGIGGNKTQTGMLSVGGALFSLGTDASTRVNIKQPTSPSPTNPEDGIYFERGGERRGYYVGMGGGLDSLVFRRNNIGGKNNVMYLSRDGKVGINREATTFNLEVDSGSITTAAELRTSLSGSVYLKFVNTSNSLGFVGYEADNLAFYANNIRQVVITPDQGGQLLVGGHATSFISNSHFEVATEGVPLATLIRNESIGANSAIGRVRFATGGGLECAAIQAFRPTGSSWNSGSSPSQLRLMTTPTATTNAVDRWSITETGLLSSGNITEATPSFLKAISINGTRKIAFGFNGNSCFFGSMADGSGTGTVDTGISVNQGNAGGTALVMISVNAGAGTNTNSALYFLKFYYDGNNTPADTLVEGGALVVWGQSANNTLTFRFNVNYNWSLSIWMAT